MKKRLLLAILWTVALAPVLAGQNGPPHRFEVASIKECKPTDRRAPATSSPGRLSLGCWPLKRLIQEAYDLYATGNAGSRASFRLGIPIEGLPDWVGSARYSIDAGAGHPETPAMMRGPMMQQLLEERFRVKTHRETRDTAVYFLTVAKGGPKLTPAREGGCIRLDPADLSQTPPPAGAYICGFPKRLKNGTIKGMEIKGITLDAFAPLLVAGRPVIDHTGLTGAYDIHIEEPPPPSPQDGARDPGAPTAALVRAQLGLRLEPGRAPREFLVIDHIERPSGN
jgi:uncharacterized protein (TIGR03435 family)